MKKMCMKLNEGFGSIKRVMTNSGAKMRRRTPW